MISASSGFQPRPDLLSDPTASMHAEDRNDIIVYETVMGMSPEELISKVSLAVEVAEAADQ